MSNTIIFLQEDEVIAFQQDQLRLYGGSPGIRDRKSLNAAIKAPQSSFEGKYLYANIFEMAASYFHGIANNHPFVDGNKRTGGICALVFLMRNGIEISMSNEDFYAAAIAVASGELSRAELALILQETSIRKPQ